MSAKLRARGARFGAFVLDCDRTGSTNTLAQSLGRAGAPHGSLVLAERQGLGKGRWGRRWESGAGGLYLSVLLRPPMPMPVGLLPLGAAVAVVDGIAEAHGVSSRLRWPNDVYAGDRKLGGVLCESSFSGDRLELAIVGFGVNVNQNRADFSEEVRGRATSIRLITGNDADVMETAAAIVSALEQLLYGKAEIRERWLALADGASGAEIRVVSREGTETTAVTAGLAPDGGLEVVLPDATKRTLYSEDVLYLRQAAREEESS